MRFRRRQSHVILLLLPSLASALAEPELDKTPTATLLNSKLPRDVTSLPTPVSDSANVPLSNISPKFGSKGTKDAPVDGKDGKPHAGPWVGIEESKKSKTDDPELVAEKAQLTIKPLDPSILDEIPQSNDGVMDDPKRESPKLGTTGTEGGITEKDKARKAKEGQTGERVEKVPDSPKEALSPPDQPTGKEVPKKTSQKESDIKDGKKDDKDDGLGGLEASLNEFNYSRNYTNFYRNQMISQKNSTIFLILYQTLQTKITSI